MPTRGSAISARLLIAAVVALTACGSGSSGRPHAADRRPVAPRRSTSTSTVATTTSTAPATTTSTTTSTTTAPNGLGALRGHVVVVDAGHNGGNAAHAAEISRPVFVGTQSRACDTTGTETADGYPEHAYTLDVALRLRVVLEQAGAIVVMVRTDDGGWGPCIDERAAIGNRAHAEVGISIHADGGPASGHGFHVNVPANIPGYTDDIYAASHALGVALRDAYSSTGITPSTYIGRDGLVERSDFGGLNLSDVPKVLFETANMQNPGDAALLEQPVMRQKIADALGAGLAGYFARSGAGI